MTQQEAAQKIDNALRELIKERLRKEKKTSNKFLTWDIPNEEVDIDINWDLENSRFVTFDEKILGGFANKLKSKNIDPIKKDTGIIILSIPEEKLINNNNGIVAITIEKPRPDGAKFRTYVRDENSTTKESKGRVTDDFLEEIYKKAKNYHPEDISKPDVLNFEIDTNTNEIKNKEQLLSDIEDLFISRYKKQEIFWQVVNEYSIEELKNLITKKPTVVKNSTGKKENTMLPLNTILYGPPGTGKTYITIEKAMEIVRNKKSSEDEKKEPSDEEKKKEATRLEITKAFNDLKIKIPTEKNEVHSDTYKIIKGQIAFITFHQSFGYEDFVEGIKPISKNGTISYEIQPGIFKLMCEAAKDNAGKNYVLIIDEINRGNISQIFGELITLIEDSKRAGEPEALEVILPYSKTAFSVPKNLYIIGTMNTADRSVEALDTALRRRFSFTEMAPDPTLLNTDLEGINLQNVLTNINTRLEYLKDRDHAIGHAFLINCKTLEDVANAFNQKIVPLLQEYFYNDYGQIQKVLGKGASDQKSFIKSTELSMDKENTTKTSYSIEKATKDTIYDFLTDLMKAPTN